jgi:hypothetical protein
MYLSCFPFPPTMQWAEEEVIIEDLTLGAGYLDFSGNMLSTLQALRHFAWHLPSRNILFTFGM